MRYFNADMAEYSVDRFGRKLFVPKNGLHKFSNNLQDAVERLDRTTYSQIIVNGINPGPDTELELIVKGVVIGYEPQLDKEYDHFGSVPKTRVRMKQIEDGKSMRVNKNRSPFAQVISPYDPYWNEMTLYLGVDHMFTEIRQTTTQIPQQQQYRRQLSGKFCEYNLSTFVS